MNYLVDTFNGTGSMYAHTGETGHTWSARGASQAGVLSSGVMDTNGTTARCGGISSATYPADASHEIHYNISAANSQWVAEASFRIAGAQEYYMSWYDGGPAAGIILDFYSPSATLCEGLPLGPDAIGDHVIRVDMGADKVVYYDGVEVFRVTENAGPVAGQMFVAIQNWNPTDDISLLGVAAFTLGAAFPILPSTLVWTDYSGALPSTGSEAWSRPVWNGTVWCTTAAWGADYGTSNKAATSPDGITWTQRTLPSNASWEKLAWNGTVFCALGAGNGSSNKAATSPDGITWTARTLPASRAWKGITAKDGVFCAVAQSSAVAATSPDGATWTERTLPSSDGWQDVTSDGSQFCAIAFGSNKAATSPNGVTWTARTLPSISNWLAIAHNGAVFCATSDSAVTAVSSDGITWTAHALPQGGSRYGIAAGDGVFCTVANNSNSALLSLDGIAWVKSPLPTSGAYYYVGFGSGRFLTTGALNKVSLSDALSVLLFWTSIVGATET